MKIQERLSGIGDFLGTFGKNAAEGALLTGTVTFGPHIFKKYAAPGLEPLCDPETALAWTVAGSLGYATYKTVIQPINNKTHETFAGIPEQIADLGNSILVKKQDADNTKSSLIANSATALWRLGMVSTFGYLCSVFSWMSQDYHPAAPIALSALSTFTGGYVLHKVASEGAKNLLSVKDNDLFNKVCESVEHLWKSGGSAIKAATIGVGIFAAAKFKETFVDPTVQSSATQGTFNAAKTAWRWSASVFNAVSPYVTGTANAVIDAVSPFYDFMFNLDNDCLPPTPTPAWGATPFPQSPLDEDLYDHKLFCDRINRNMPFIKTYIQPVWNAGAKITGGIAYGASKTWKTCTWATGSTWKATTGTIGIISGLIWREATLKSCEDSTFKTANEFLCTNAGRIDSLFKNYLNPFAAKVSGATTWTGQKIHSGGKTAWAATTGTIGIISGLIWRKATLESCQDSNFKAANDFLCTNAGRIEDLFNNYLNPFASKVSGAASWTSQKIHSGGKTAWTATAGVFGVISGLIWREQTLKDCATGTLNPNEFLCTNATRIDDFVNNYWTPFVGSVGGAASWIKDQSIEKALDPTVQKYALITIAAGASLYALHYVATKTMQYYAKPTAPVEEEKDIEQGPKEDNTIPLPSEDSTMPLPSAPPMPPEMIDSLNEEKVPSLNPVSDSTLQDKEVLKTSDIEMPLEVPSLEPTDINVEQPSAPVTFWSKLESTMTSFVEGMKVWMESVYSSLSTWWENLWNKKTGQ